MFFQRFPFYFISPSLFVFVIFFFDRLLSSLNCKRIWSGNASPRSYHLKGSQSWRLHENTCSCSPVFFFSFLQSPLRISVLWLVSNRASNTECIFFFFFLIMYFIFRVIITSFLSLKKFFITKILP